MSSRINTYRSIEQCPKDPVTDYGTTDVKDRVVSNCQLIRQLHNENTKDEYGCCDKYYRHDGMKRLPKQFRYRSCGSRLLPLGSREQKKK